MRSPKGASLDVMRPDKEGAGEGSGFSRLRSRSRSKATRSASGGWLYSLLLAEGAGSATGAGTEGSLLFLAGTYESRSPRTKVRRLSSGELEVCMRSNSLRDSAESVVPTDVMRSCKERDVFRGGELSRERGRSEMRESNGARVDSKAGRLLLRSSKESRSRPRPLEDLDRLIGGGGEERRRF
jgi:hypothetical protein